MSAITWLEVEGVRYESQGDSLLCQTSIGFHSQLPGHMLDGLEVSDDHGRPLGFLSVNFDSGAMAFSPLVTTSELTKTELLVGDSLGAHIVALDELSSANVGDLLSSDSDLILPERYVDYADEPVMTDLSLDCLVSAADETLDAFFGESAAPVVLPAQSLDDLSLTLTTLYLEHGADPALMPMHPEPIDPSLIL